MVGKNPLQRSTFATEQAREKLKSMLIGGIVVSFMGGLVLGMALAAGSGVMTYLGLVIGWIGSALLTVSLIGYGVKLGREAANV